MAEFLHAEFVVDFQPDAMLMKTSRVTTINLRPPEPEWKYHSRRSPKPGLRYMYFTGSAWREVRPRRSARAKDRVILSRYARLRALGAFCIAERGIPVDCATPLDAEILGARVGSEGFA